MTVTIITGGSRGIGAAVARKLGHGPTGPGGGNQSAADNEPHHLIINYRSDHQAAETVVRQVTGDTIVAHPVRADVADEEQVLDLFAVADRLGPLTGLVNNAGIVQPIARFEDYTVERLQQIMAVNVVGAFLCAREAVKRMSTRHDGGGGSIVNVSSRASTLGSGNEYIDYAASKGAIDTMTVGLAAETGRCGIRVNAVRPGLIATDIHRDSGNPDRIHQHAGKVPLGRPGEPEEVANLICWLLSGEASYLTGALIDIGGGR